MEQGAPEVGGTRDHDDIDSKPSLRTLKDEGEEIIFLFAFNCYHRLSLPER